MRSQYQGVGRPSKIGESSTTADVAVGGQRTSTRDSAAAAGNGVSESVLQQRPQLATIIQSPKRNIFTTTSTYKPIYQSLLKTVASEKGDVRRGYVGDDRYVRPQNGGEGVGDSRRAAHPTSNTAGLTAIRVYVKLVEDWYGPRDCRRRDVVALAAAGAGASASSNPRHERHHADDASDGYAISRPDAEGHEEAPRQQRTNSILGQYPSAVVANTRQVPALSHRQQRPGGGSAAHSSAAESDGVPPSRVPWEHSRPLSRQSDGLDVMSALLEATAIANSTAADESSGEDSANIHRGCEDEDDTTTAVGGESDHDTFNASADETFVSGVGAYDTLKTRHGVPLSCVSAAAAVAAVVGEDPAGVGVAAMWGNSGASAAVDNTTITTTTADTYTNTTNKLAYTPIMERYRSDDATSDDGRGVGGGVGVRGLLHRRGSDVAAVAIPADDSLAPTRAEVEEDSMLPELSHINGGQGNELGAPTGAGEGEEGVAYDNDDGDAEGGIDHTEDDASNLRQHHTVVSEEDASIADAIINAHHPSWDQPFILVTNIDLAKDDVEACVLKALASARRLQWGPIGKGSGLVAAEMQRQQEQARGTITTGGGGKDNVTYNLSTNPLYGFGASQRAVPLASYDVFLGDKHGYVIGEGWQLRSRHATTVAGGGSTMRVGQRVLPTATFAASASASNTNTLLGGSAAVAGSRTMKAAYEAAARAVEEAPADASAADLFAIHQQVVSSYSDFTPVPLSEPSAIILTQEEFTDVYGRGGGTTGTGNGGPTSGVPMRNHQQPSSTTSMQVMNRTPLTVRRSLIVVPKPPRDAHPKVITGIYEAMNSRIAEDHNLVEVYYKRRQKLEREAVNLIRNANVTRLFEDRATRELQEVLRTYKCEDNRLLEVGLAKRERARQLQRMLRLSRGSLGGFGVGGHGPSNASSGAPFSSAGGGALEEDVDDGGFTDVEGYTTAASSNRSSYAVTPIPSALGDV